MRKNNSKYLIFSALLLLIFILSGINFIIHKSITADEVAHIPAGWTYWKFQDFRINPEHPPLIKYWCSIPLLFMNLKSMNSTAWKMSDEWNYGRNFIFNWNCDKPVVFYSKFMNLLLGALCGIILFFFIKELFNEKTAVIALIFYTFCPEIIAHSSLVTTDLGNALFYLLSFYGIHLITHDKTRQGVILLAIGIAGGHITKHSFVMITPIIIIWLIISAAIEIIKIKNSTGKEAQKIIVKYLSIIIGIFIFSYFILWASFGFKYKSIPDDANYFISWERFFIKGAPGKAIDFLRESKIAPEAYIYGWNDVLKKGDRPTYIWGTTYPKGVWFYFPSTFILKTPIALLTALLIAIIFHISTKLCRGLKKSHIENKNGEDKKNEIDSSNLPAILWIPPLYYMIFFILLVRLNIGNRHILPVYPFVCAIGASGITILLKTRKTKLLGAAIVAGYITASLTASPDYLSFVNIIGGGHSNGWRNVADSNYDWGQDLKNLIKWSEKNDNPEIRISYFGNDDTNKLRRNFIPVTFFNAEGTGGLDYDVIKDNIRLKGYYAVSANLLAGYLGEYLLGFNPYEYFKDKKYAGEAGHSIKIYYIDEDSSTTLIDAAIEVYTHQIEKKPSDNKVFLKLASAMYFRKDADEKLIPILQTAIDKNPLEPELYIKLAEIHHIKKSYHKALLVYQNASQKLPSENKKILVNMSDIYYEIGEYQKAFECLTKALQFAPEYFDIRHKLALAAIKLRDFKTAEAALEAAEKIDGTSYIIPNLYGQLCLAKGDYDRAVIYLKKACAMNPKFAAGYNNLGFAYLKKGDKNSARENFEKALSITPDNPIYRENVEAMKQ